MHASRRHSFRFVFSISIIIFSCVSAQIQRSYLFRQHFGYCLSVVKRCSATLIWINRTANVFDVVPYDIWAVASMRSLLPGGSELIDSLVLLWDHSIQSFHTYFWADSNLKLKMYNYSLIRWLSFIAVTVTCGVNRCRCFLSRLCLLMFFLFEIAVDFSLGQARGQTPNRFLHLDSFVLDSFSAFTVNPNLKTVTGQPLFHCLCFKCFSLSRSAATLCCCWWCVCDVCTMYACALVAVVVLLPAGVEL